MYIAYETARDVRRDQHPYTYRIHKPVLATRYSGTYLVARLAPITVYYEHLHIDESGGVARGVPVAKVGGVLTR